MVSFWVEVPAISNMGGTLWVTLKLNKGKLQDIKVPIVYSSHFRGSTPRQLTLVSRMEPGSQFGFSEPRYVLVGDGMPSLLVLSQDL